MACLEGIFALKRDCFSFLSCTTSLVPDYSTEVYDHSSIATVVKEQASFPRDKM